VRAVETALVLMLTLALAYFGFRAFGDEWPLNLAAALLVAVLFLSFAYALDRGRR
jgi:hypothetical protein